MDMAAIIDRTLIGINFKASGKEEALKKIASIAAESQLLKNIGPAEILSAIREREKMGTTGFGGGIAIPHARLKGLSGFVVFVLVSGKGVDFEALDGKKVNIFCVILAPEEMVNEHLKVLAAFSRYLSRPGFKRELLNAKTPQVVFEAFARQSEAPAHPASGKKMKLLILVLYFDEYLYQILEYFLEHGIRGATIIESGGMGAYVSSIPLFASFLGFMRDDKNQSKTIMCLIPEESENIIIEGIERITGSLDKKEGAMVMTLPLSLHKGTMEIM